MKETLGALSPANYLRRQRPRNSPPFFDTGWLTAHYGLYWGIIQGAVSLKEAGIDAALYADAIKVMGSPPFLKSFAPNVKSMIAKDSFGPRHRGIHRCTGHGNRRNRKRAGTRWLCRRPLKAIGDLNEKAAAGGDGDKNMEAIAKYLKR